MSAFPHAEQFVEVTQILANEGSSPHDLAKVLGFMSTLVRENAEMDENLREASAANRVLRNLKDHALSVADDLRAQLVEARSESLAASEKLAAAQEFNAARNDASTVREQELIKKCSDLEFHLKTKQVIDQSMEVAAGGGDGGVHTENYQHEIRDSKDNSSMDTKIEKQRQRARSQTQNHHVWGGRILVPSFLEEDEGY